MTAPTKGRDIVGGLEIRRTAGRTPEWVICPAEPIAGKVWGMNAHPTRKRDAAALRERVLDLLPGRDFAGAFDEEGMHRDGNAAGVVLFTKLAQLDADAKVILERQRLKLCLECDSRYRGAGRGGEHPTPEKLAAHIRQAGPSAGRPGPPLTAEQVGWAR